jgi:hypothetical protein
VPAVVGTEAGLAIGANANAKPMAAAIETARSIVILLHRIGQEKLNDGFAGFELLATALDRLAGGADGPCAAIA